MQDETVRERLAAYAHDAWTGWMKYLFSKSISNSDGTVTIPKWAVNRWKMQVETSYKELPEEMKESDRKEADRMLAIVGESNAFAICAFRELRKAWFNAHLKKGAHEREWENKEAEARRKTDNAELKIKFDLQTEQIIKGIKKPISPTCHYDMTNVNNFDTTGADNCYKPKTNYIPDSMSFAEGFLGPKGDVGYFMVANYKKAKNIIESLLKQKKNIERVEMGLDGDWRENSCVIFDGDGHNEYDCYELSQWAEPIMIVYYKDAPSEKYPVWKKEDKGKEKTNDS